MTKHFQKWHFICSKHLQTPLASELCSMSRGVTFSATRPGYWSPANDARLWLRAIFISTNENRMAWKMWRFEQFYWVTASHHPSAVWVLGDLFGYHALHKACHLPVRWPKHPRSNSSKRVFFHLKLCVYSLPIIPPVGRNCHKFGNCRNPEHSNFFHISIKQFS